MLQGLVDLCPWEQVAEDVKVEEGGIGRWPRVYYRAVGADAECRGVYERESVVPMVHMQLELVPVSEVWVCGQTGMGPVTSGRRQAVAGEVDGIFTSLFSEG